MYLHAESWNAETTWQKLSRQEHDCFEQMNPRGELVGGSGS